MKVILRTEDLCKTYGAGESLVRAVDHIDLEIKRGEFVSVIGKSGSGKSTLLNLMSGLDRPTSGKVFIGDTDIFQLKEDKMAVMRRRKIGFIFQAYNLISSLNVWENVVLPLGLDDRKIDKQWIMDVLTTLGIENKIHNLPETLSGGQRQRVAIARALVTRPELIFADEPTGNLDSKTSDEVITMLKIAAEKYGQTVVMITHDEDAAQAADRIITIEDGRVVNIK